MRYISILKCKGESTKNATTNGGPNIPYGRYLIKTEIASKRKHETIDEEFINDEEVGNFKQ